MSELLSRNAYLAKYGYPFIPDNQETELTPWIIGFKPRGMLQGSVWVQIRKAWDEDTPSWKVYCSRTTGRTWNVGQTILAFVGTTARCNFRQRLPLFLLHRDVANTIHRLHLKKGKITAELMERARTTDVALHRELIEACCIAAL